MDEHETRRGLPPAYGLSLCLADLGFGEEHIASVLSIEPEAVPKLLKLARMKLERLRREAPGGSHRP